MRRIPIDTRDLRPKGAWDGFVHLVPRSTWLAKVHSLSTQCWCDPTVRWPENGATLVVSHNDKRPWKAVCW